MYVIAFNGSPRKDGTTATLLKKSLEGATSKGAETEFIQLNALRMKGCQACFECKKRDGKSYGKCNLKDDMTPLYQKIERCDALVIGSPIYLGGVTASTKIFIERLFPYVSYKDFSSNFPKKINTGFIFTMGVEGRQIEMFSQIVQFNQGLFTGWFASCETLISTDTFHVEDYSTIAADMLEQCVDRKLKHRQEVFPKDCEKAFDMGAKFGSENRQMSI